MILVHLFRRGFRYKGRSVIGGRGAFSMRTTYADNESGWHNGFYTNYETDDCFLVFCFLCIFCFSLSTIHIYLPVHVCVCCFLLNRRWAKLLRVPSNTEVCISSFLSLSFFFSLYLSPPLGFFSRYNYAFRLFTSICLFVFVVFS